MQYVEYPAEVIVTAREYIRLQERDQHPVGTWDKARRFYLTEYYSCCQGLHKPTRAYPFSEMLHGRTMTHLACQYHVDLSLLRKCVAQEKKMHAFVNRIIGSHVPA